MHDPIAIQIAQAEVVNAERHEKLAEAEHAESSRRLGKAYDHTAATRRRLAIVTGPGADGRTLVRNKVGAVIDVRA